MKKINDIIKLFKQLQLSIPVNIESWDEENFTPLVGFREVNENGYLDKIITYDENGNKKIIDGKTQPDKPIIIININERTDELGNIKKEFKNENNLEFVTSKPNIRSTVINYVPNPINVTGNYVNNYIILTWELQTTNVGTYSIEIQKEINGLFTTISTQETYGGQDSYIDNNGGVPFPTGTTYLYRIRTVYTDEFQDIYYSSYSQIIYVTVNTSGLQAPTNFTAKCVGPNNIRLTWNFPININITGFKIRRIRPLIGESFENDIPSIVSYSAREYIDLATKVIGDQYEYEIRAYNSSGESLPSWDITYNPYRTQFDHLYLSKIRFLNISEFESWDMGKPEIEITLAHGDYDGDKTPSIIYRQERLSILKEIIPRSNSYLHAEYGFCFDVLGSNWDSNFFKQVLNFNFIEYDAPGLLTGWKGVNFKVSVPIKIGVAEIKIEAATDLNFNIKKTSEEIGESYYTFWMPKESSFQIHDDIIVYLTTNYPVW